jgi:DNA-binding GntR family transcriptional regulator
VAPSRAAAAFTCEFTPSSKVDTPSPGRPEASLDELAEILGAMMAGDTAAAEQATRRHVARVIHALESALPG